MNYTETFNEFASRVTPLDLALYAGVGIILWVLLKERLNPIQKFISDFISNIKNKTDSVASPPSAKPIVSIITPKKNADDVFFKLVSSWKQTRDLAVLSGCSEAVKVADQMFPFLSPNVCVDTVKVEAKDSTL